MKICNLVDPNSKVKGNFSLYSLFLSGKIEYNPPNNNMERVLGRVSLTKDPKGEVFDRKNIILKGSKIQNTDWLVTLS